MELISHLSWFKGINASDSGISYYQPTNCLTSISMGHFSPSTHEVLPSVCCSSGPSAGQWLKARMSWWPGPCQTQPTLSLPLRRHEQGQPVPSCFFRGYGCTAQASSSPGELQVQGQFSHDPHRNHPSIEPDEVRSQVTR